MYGGRPSGTLRRDPTPYPPPHGVTLGEVKACGRNAIDRVCGSHALFTYHNGDDVVIHSFIHCCVCEHIMCVHVGTYLHPATCLPAACAGCVCCVCCLPATCCLPAPRAALCAQRSGRGAAQRVGWRAGLCPVHPCPWHPCALGVRGVRRAQRGSPPARGDQRLHADPAAPPGVAARVGRCQVVEVSRASSSG